MLARFVFFVWIGLAGAIPSASACPFTGVFFDSGSVALRDSQRAAIKEWVRWHTDAPEHCRRSALIMGWTDTEEAGVDGQADLDVRRAEMVRSVMIEAGWPMDRISLHSDAANRPIPTAPGIPEPQNRRAQIVFFSNVRGQLKCETGSMTSCGPPCRIELANGLSCQP